MAFPYVAGILTSLINLCLKRRTFPDCLKIAKITPVFKGGNKNDLGNYRPILVLPVISRVLEKCINTRVYDHLELHNLLNPIQFGFRKGRTTEMALSYITSVINGALDNKLRVAGLFLDLVKAFDTVDHQLLLQKCEFYGLRGATLALLCDYLQNREHYVHINGFSSTSRRCPQTVDYLLTHGADVNVIEDNGGSPLHLAASEGCSQTVDYLLKYRAHVDCVYTSEKGSTEVVHQLLDSDANVDAKGEDSNVPLHIAVFNKKKPLSNFFYGIAVRGNPRRYREVVEALLKYGFCVNPEDANNTELVHAAVENGYVNIVEDFFKYGANVNALLGRSGLTLLHNAVINKQEEVANLLISNEADINARDENGKTPIFYATENADISLTKFLLANVKDSPEVLFKAVETECVEIVKVLLRYDADVNATDKYGRTALHRIALQDNGFAVVRKCKSPEVKDAIAKLLLNRGAGVNTQTIKGETALHFAIENDNTKVVETILEC
ncbi:putative ankyrin repeat protein RF_0381 [Artemia franciscana]|uniref:putative ankyrin repeat protein RF_0381 n=1 Tax=Artemia franciscana TaxID=6661 RepID=UPI0032D9FB78